MEDMDICDQQILIWADACIINTVKFMLIQCINTVKFMRYRSKVKGFNHIIYKKKRPK